MENSSTIKIGPVGAPNVGNIWDDKGRTEIVQIFVSYDTKIHSLQFQYANENGELELSDKHGPNTEGDSFNIVNLNYPSEYIISISGKYSHGSGSGPGPGDIYLASITFATNLGTHGPFGKPPRGEPKGFMLHLGSKREFGGFHGTADNIALRSIGMYVNRISNLESFKEKDAPKLHCHNEDDVAII